MKTIDTAKELLDAIEILIKQAVRDNSTQIYSGICKSVVDTSSCVMAINGRENNVKFYGASPNVGNIYRVFVPSGNMSMAFIITANAPIMQTITLSSSSWSSTAKTQTVAVPGVLADETKQLITPTPASSSQTAYYNAGIRCTSQAADSLTFTATTVPSVDLTVYVTIQGVSTS